MLDNGTIIQFNFDLKVDGKVRETTREATAKAAKLGGSDYRPITAIIGQGGLLRGLEDAIRQHGFQGAIFGVELPPEKAYGRRLPANTKTFPIARFGKIEGGPKVGGRVEAGGKAGVVVKLGGGRATVDFNHDLAGKTLHFEVEVLEVATSIMDKAELIVGLIALSNDSATVELTDSELRVHLPSYFPMHPDGARARASIVRDLRIALVDSRRDIVLIERHAAPPLPVEPKVEEATA